MPSNENDIDFAPPEEDPFAPDKRARPHHYAFAYNILPQFVYWDPVKFEQAAVQKDMPKILRHLWDQVAQELDVKDRLPSAQLDCLVDELDGMTRVIVVLPPTERTMEAIALGVLIASDKPGAFEMFKKTEPEVHIFSLERSYPEEGKPMNMVGFFSKDRGRCGNLGAGPSDAEGFKNWIADHMRDLRSEQS